MGLFNLFVKKKETPKPFNFQSSMDKPSGFRPLPPNKGELGSIKDLTFPKIPESKPKPFLPPMPSTPKEHKPFDLPNVSETKMPEPHLFVKVAKYQQVRESSKKLGEKLKDLTGVLEKLEDLKKEEQQRISVLRETLKNMSDSASELDKTFRAAREEYE